MNRNKQYSFIFEQTSVVSPGELQILSEIKLPDGKSKLSFRSRLQESNTRNNNRRIYSDTICESIVSQLGPRASSRSLLMEVDH